MSLSKENKQHMIAGGAALLLVAAGFYSYWSSRNNVNLEDAVVETFRPPPIAATTKFGE